MKTYGYYLSGSGTGVGAMEFIFKDGTSLIIGSGPLNIPIE
jgi:hypothetical protein